MRSQSPAPEPREARMFGTLVASRPRLEGRAAVGSTVGSIVVHALLIAVLVYATSRASATPAPADLTRVISLAPPPVPVTPPPPMEDSPLPPSAAPVPFGFKTIPMPDVVPPVIPPAQPGLQIRAEDFSGQGVRDGAANGDSSGSSEPSDASVAPFIVPMSLPPKLLNVEDVRRAVSGNYPPILRDAGITGTTTMWFYIDETGRAVKHQVFKSSGNAALDEAAGKVAGIMRFAPAQQQDRKIAVWVQIPIVFRIQ